MELWLAEQVEHALATAGGIAGLVGALIVAVGLAAGSIWGFGRLAGRVEAREALSTRSPTDFLWGWGEVLIVFGYWLAGEFIAGGAAMIIDGSLSGSAGTPGSSGGAGAVDGWGPTAKAVFSAVGFVVRVSAVGVLAFLLWTRALARPTSGSTEGERSDPVSVARVFGALRTIGLDAEHAVCRAGAGLLAFLVTAPAWIIVTEAWAIALILGEVAPESQEVVRTFHEGVTQGEWVLLISLALTAVIAAPLYEEVLFRGLIAPLLEQKWGRGVAVVGSALVFTAVHPTWQASVPIFALGLGLAYYRLRTGDLVGCIVWHAIFNASQLIVLIAIAS